jgi:hypothetical protein
VDEKAYLSQIYLCGLMGDDQSQSENAERGESASQASEIVEDNWSHLTDPEERRRVQNRNAQRRFRKCLPNGLLFSSPFPRLGGSGVYLACPNVISIHPDCPNRWIFSFFLAVAMFGPDTFESLIIIICANYTGVSRLLGPGEKAKLRKDEEEKKRQEDQQAAFAYEPPRPEQLDARDNVPGLPWGSFPIAQAVEAGRAKEEEEEEQRRESLKEPSRATSDTPAYHQPPKEDPKQ